MLRMILMMKLMAGTFRNGKHGVFQGIDGDLLNQHRIHGDHQKFLRGGRLNLTQMHINFSKNFASKSVPFSSSVNAIEPVASVFLLYNKAQPTPNIKSHF